jgi:hypothetical protein
MYVLDWTCIGGLAPAAPIGKAFDVDNGHREDSTDARCTSGVCILAASI